MGSNVTVVTVIRRLLEPRRLLTNTPHDEGRDPSSTKSTRGGGVVPPPFLFPSKSTRGGGMTPPPSSFLSKSMRGGRTTPPSLNDPSSVLFPFEIDARRRDDPSSVLIPFEFDARRRDDPSSGSLTFETDAHPLAPFPSKPTPEEGRPLLRLVSLRIRRQEEGRPLLRLPSLRKPYSKLRGGGTLPTVFLSAVARRVLPPRDLPAQFQRVSTRAGRFLLYL